MPCREKSCHLGPDTYLVLNYEYGGLKILGLTVLTLLFSYYFDLYDSSILDNRREVIVRLTQVLGTVYCLLALLYYIYPGMELGRGISVIGLLFVTTECRKPPQCGRQRRRLAPDRRPIGGNFFRIADLRVARTCFGAAIKPLVACRRTRRASIQPRPTVR